jgi:hypothetical protein
MNGYIYGSLLSDPLISILDKNLTFISWSSFNVCAFFFNDGNLTKHGHFVYLFLNEKTLDMCEMYFSHGSSKARLCCGRCPRKLFVFRGNPNFHHQTWG